MTSSKQRAGSSCRDGFLAGGRFISEAETVLYREQFNHIEAKPGLINSHWEGQFGWDIATHPNLRDTLESLIGSDVMVEGAHFFCKRGSSEKYVAWHQEVTYRNLDPRFFQKSPP